MPGRGIKRQSQPNERTMCAHGTSKLSCLMASSRTLHELEEVCQKILRKPERCKDEVSSMYHVGKSSSAKKLTRHGVRDPGAAEMIQG